MPPPPGNSFYIKAGGKTLQPLIHLQIFIFLSCNKKHQAGHSGECGVSRPNVEPGKHAHFHSRQETETQKGGSLAQFYELRVESHSILMPPEASGEKLQLPPLHSLPSESRAPISQTQDWTEAEAAPSAPRLRTPDTHSLLSKGLRVPSYSRARQMRKAKIHNMTVAPGRD